MSQDYMENGLLHCGKCHTPKQADIDGIGRVPVLCRCESERRRREEEQDRRQSAYLSAMRLAPQEIRICPDAEHCDERVARWLSHWEEMREKNIGLLLWGEVGTGKTASCAHVERELKRQYIPCLLTSFPKLVSYDRGSVIPRLKVFDLLILDDLGAERQSEYMMEKVLEIVDDRVTQRRPVILTTNLSLHELKNEPDVRLRRIYDRILSVCVPIRFRGQSHRKAQAATLLQAAQKLIEDGDAR